MSNTTILPIIFEFSGVEGGANLSIILSTPGVAWSIGGAPLESVGFSLNAMALGANRATPIESIEMGESELFIQTAKYVSSQSFVLSAHLCVVGDMQQVEACCALNDGAEIRVSIPCHQGVEWRRGLNSMLLPLQHDSYRTARIVLRGLRPDRKVRFELDAETCSGARLRWSLGTQLLTGAGFALRTLDGNALNMTSFMIDEKTIELSYGDSPAANSDGELMVELWVESVASKDESGVSSKQIERLLLKMESSADVIAIAQIGNRQPQYVVSSFTPFSL
jgi:hypothetical protein